MKVSPSHRSLFPLLVIAGFIPSGAAAAAPDAKDADKVFVGYLYGQTRACEFPAVYPSLPRLLDRRRRGKGAARRSVA